MTPEEIEKLRAVLDSDSCGGGHAMKIAHKALDEVERLNKSLRLDHEIRKKMSNDLTAADLEIENLHAEIKKLNSAQDKLAIAIEALEFYATYKCKAHPNNEVYVDHGFKSRQSLAQIKGSIDEDGINKTVLKNE